MISALIRSPFRRIRQCVEMIDGINGVIDNINDMIRSMFISFLKHQYGVEVYELSSLAYALSSLEVEDSNFILADTRGVEWLIAYFCGADVEHEYKIETTSRPIYVQFVSWVPMRCVDCSFSVDSNKLVLMPMTAVILRFSNPQRIRVTGQLKGPQSF